jgi:hypothetical protein
LTSRSIKNQSLPNCYFRTSAWHLLFWNSVSRYFMLPLPKKV